MNKKIIINSAWVVFAGATFAIGRMSANSGSDGAATNRELKQRSPLSSIIPSDSDTVKGKPAPNDANFLAKYFHGESTELSKEDMAAAMREALAEGDPVKRALMMAQLLQNLTPENVQEALAALRESPDRRENFQYMALLQFAWGKIDGAAAVAAAQESGGRGGAFGTMSALSGWASTDGEGAKAWVEAQEDGREKSMYMNGLIEGLAKTDPAAATAYVLEMSEAIDGGRGGGDMRNRYIANIANEMLKQGVDAASSWANGLPEGSMRESALGEVADFYARQDTATAAAWIESYADSADAKGAVREIADRWARETPQEAAEWVAGLPEIAQADAMRSVFDEWADKQPVEASEYLATMEPSAGRDSAVSGFSQELAKEDPSSAIEWAASIADEALRASTELSVAQRWYREEPEAAQAWAQENLPAESQQAITQPQRGGDAGGRGPGRGGR